MDKDSKHESLSHWGLHEVPITRAEMHDRYDIVDEDFDEDAKTVIDMLCLRGRLLP